MYLIIIKLKKSLIYYNITSKVLIIFILILFSSCTKNEPINLKEGARFIDLKVNILNTDHKKIKLSTSYVENKNRICIYIKNDTKIIKEVSKNEECLDEI
tara:strand:- start:197 stop:496 length:300 start_codon:yes stop_codon:yes gene_type:complete